MNALLLWVALAAAQPSPEAAAPPEPAAPTEGAANPTESGCPAADPLIERLRAADAAEASGCLVKADDAGPALLSAIVAGGPGTERLTRTLALWRMQRLDERIPDAEARALSAADRRLLRDAVQARRGRATPAAEHAAIFSQYDWYKPDPRYMPNRLNEQDRENMGLLDKPPPEPPPEPPASEAMSDAQEEAPAPVGTGFCGCATSSSEGSGPLGLVGLMIGLGALRRRR